MHTVTAFTRNPPYSTSPLLAQFDCIEHGFFGNQGGISRGVYASLNCAHSSNDDSADITQNRTRVAALFNVPEAKLFSVKQAHTNTVIGISSLTEALFNSTADAMVTDEPGLALGVLGADCAPVLFVDPVARVIGAAHAGWKGALLGVNEAVIQKMLELGASLANLQVAIGPAMQSVEYEVQAEFKQHFARESKIESAVYFSQRDERLFFDTPGYIQACLGAAGICNVDISAEDTFTQPKKYFSYRRACHHQAADYGRQISMIVLNAS